MNDTETLQGLWRLHSPPMPGAGTHYLIQGNSMHEIVPGFISDGKLRPTFLLDESTSPKRLTEVLDYNGPDGPPDPNPITVKYLYQLDGDTLVLCQGVGGSFPTSICDQYLIKTFIRDLGPIPQTPRPSNTPPVVDKELGTLQWDDNFSWYCGEVELPTAAFELVLNPDEGTNATRTLARAKQIASNLESYRELTADYAVDGLLSLKNVEWRDDNEDEYDYEGEGNDDGEGDVTPDEFKSKMVLSTIVINTDMSVEFSYFDGGLFFGHMINVCIDSNDACSETRI